VGLDRRAALEAAEQKMRRAGADDVSVEAFRRRFAQLERPDAGLLPGDRLESVDDVALLGDLERPATRAELDRAVVIKLNGGLGTTMGLSMPKSLVEVKPGHTFLDVIVRQVLALRRRHDVRLPLVLMNSFHTREPTLKALEGRAGQAQGGARGLTQDVPLDFLQNSEPKLRADDLMPIDWPDDRELEWCPPGHGDLYAALAASGMLDALLERGYEYAFVSNADNLAAVLDARLLGHIADRGLQFVMEVVVGTEADRKGGHVARLEDGRLVLRETAQVPKGDDSFTDFLRWRFYNSNNLWVHLPALAERGAALDLPLIVNRKTVDPADPSTPKVLQLETAMGAAIGAFERAEPVCVPRSRFVPVKSTNDLLVARSDAYLLDEDSGRLDPATQHIADNPPVVDLDPRFYKRLVDFEQRFPAGPPSLAGAERLEVRGDVRFG
jgi:UTP--glucose-1-phosphate uridylyltransferase